MLLWATPEAALPPSVAAELERLEGHEVQIEDDGYTIVDVAGEGAPLVGCIEQSERGLELVSDGKRHLLSGPLAVPRIAGPNYKVWILGQLDGAGELQAKRLGILAGPSACTNATEG